MQHSQEQQAAAVWQDAYARIAEMRAQVREFDALELQRLSRKLSSTVLNL